jgi:exodeoxyribonuclease-5
LAIKTTDILELLRKTSTIEPTASQRAFMERMSYFMASDERFKIFLLKGYAGTGKTTMLKTYVHFLEKLNINVVLLAPTGRAAKVLFAYTGKKAYTIHKQIYNLKRNAGYIFLELAHNPHHNTVFIVDEASMIGNTPGSNENFGQQRRLLEDLLRYIYRGKKCVAVFSGDDAQLPPVGSVISPALNKTYIEQHFNLVVFEALLTDVVRQQALSGILANATHIRKLISLNHTVDPQINFNFPDIVNISTTQLEDELQTAYNQYGIEGCLVITRSNKRANNFNRQIRARILQFEDELCAGDRLMVVKNNYHWLDNHNPIGFIANGDIIQLLRVKNKENLYAQDFANVRVEFNDYEQDTAIELKIILSSLYTESANLPQQVMQELYKNIEPDYMDEPNKNKKREKILNNDYYNALQVKYAYAVTCHKAQGGQWPCVFIDRGYFTDEMLNLEYLRWLYTAFTRASEKLFLINF